MRVANDPTQTRSAGDALTAAGGDLIAAASEADLGEGAGGDAAPRTDAALGLLNRGWRTALTALGGQVENLGTYANLVAAAFEKLDGAGR